MVRRELLDRMLSLGRRHLQMALEIYVAHYNKHRRHRLLGQAAPLGAVPCPLARPAYGSCGEVGSAA
jgi:putative transposase